MIYSLFFIIQISATCVPRSGSPSTFCAQENLNRSSPSFVISFVIEHSKISLLRILRNELNPILIVFCSNANLTLEARFLVHFVAFKATTTIW